MSDRRGLMDRIEAQLDQLSDRERLLAGVALATFAFLGIVLAAGISLQTVARRTDALEERRAALAEVIAQRGTFLEASARNADLQERLRNNDLRMSSFIEATARKLGLGKPSEFRDAQTPLPAHPGITAHSTTATLDGISIEQLDELLREVGTTSELVWVQQVEVRPSRRGGAGKLDMELTLTTYRRSGGKGDE